MPNVVLSPEHGDHVPTLARPVKVRARDLPADAHFLPHRHAWAQLAFCNTGITQVVVSTPSEVTYIVPPSRAVWIPPGELHSVSVVETARLRTLYLDPSTVPAGWTEGRLIIVSPLLRELILALEAGASAQDAVIEAALGTLILAEIARADTQTLGVPMPRDKRLRALCEAVLREPTAHATLADWVAGVGASERTIARLFRDELATTYQQWRQQALLARALPMLARGLPISQVAAASGYASDSAFSAMFKSAMGLSPSRFAATAKAGPAR